DDAMTTRTRYAIVVSMLVIAVGVGTGLVAYYMGGQAGTTADQLAELRFLPRDTAVIVYANVHDLMASEMQRRASGVFPGPQAGRRGFEEATGINIETDIDRAVLFVEGRGAGGEPPVGAALARGRFNEVKIQTLALEHGGTAETYKGKRLVISTPAAASA